MINEKSYRPSFYLTINSLFIVFILIVGGILVWHNYRDTKNIVLTEVALEYDQTMGAFLKDIQHTYKPIFDTVHLLSMTPVMEAETLDERLQQLSVLVAALAGKTELAGLQIGYENGDYFIVRTVATGRVRELFFAPEQTAYVVDHITTDLLSGKKFLERFFYDGAMLELLRRPPEATEYDPRIRPWYIQALQTERVSGVEPYLFYFLKEIGTTISYRKPGSRTVIAADVTLMQLSETLRQYMLTTSSEIALIDADGMIIAYNKPGQNIIKLDGDHFKIAHIGELGSEIFSFMNKQNLLHAGPLQFQYQGKDWHGSARTFTLSEQGRELTLVMLSPLEELLSNVIAMVRRSLLITLGILLLSIPLASFVARMISKDLNKLAEEAVMISQFKFDQPRVLHSKIKEVDELARSMELMKNTISRFLALLKSLANEQNFDSMLEQITEETLNVSETDGVLTWFVDDTNDMLKPVALFSRDKGKSGLEGLPSYSVVGKQSLADAARQSNVSHWLLRKDDNDGLSELFRMFDVEVIEVTAFPLRNRKDEGIGLLCLLHKVTDESLENEASVGRMDFVRTFSGFASVSLESRHLLEMQKRLMDSFMHLLAGAIDAKSPYTGGHCQRVPVLAKMLAKAACQDDGLFKDYQLDEDGWEALHLAGWLHDCGKVTTPEYVVDKATKLETIYDRIHEIRTRFEILKRDAEIRYWEQVADGGDRPALRKILDREQREIDEDFLFVAGCNLGDEIVTPEQVERLEQIAQRTWYRTLDNRVGISWEEEKRRSRQPKVELPAEECILADRVDHLIERSEGERIPADNHWGFKINVPEYRYNQGELYNLKIGRGTLTAEERYKISDHVVQTIIMLEKLPYPKHLREVPAIAGGHHETMDGNGYPKKLNKDQISLTARMMAIADIFEALTASDRPYKKAKKLSDSIRVMSFFKKDQHIDPDLFDLFLRSGVYLDYAREYLDPGQIDEVDIASYLS
ncbi:MAG: HD domain-containing phosphohydrolase [Desulfuromusa sp.]|nr:HD domain-containing phosphohydrolase [Desulfuromusa sp.]